jgi:hypothetical protein
LTPKGYHFVMSRLNKCPCRMFGGNKGSGVRRQLWPRSPGVPRNSRFRDGPQEANGSNRRLWGNPDGPVN